MMSRSLKLALVGALAALALAGCRHPHRYLPHPHPTAPHVSAGASGQTAVALNE